MSLILSGTDGLSDVDGTAATPALRGTDANTGIFFPAADTIAFSEGGAEAMRLDSSGNVGIGTTSTAGYALAIQRTGDNALMKLTAVTSGGAGIDLINAGGSEISYVGASGNNVLTFRTGGTERMRISSAGAVGIGTTVLTQFSLRLGKNITGNVDSYAVRSDGVVQSDVTSSAALFATFASTQAASFTLTNLRHFQALQSTIGATSTVTNQFGFFADSTLTGATNNYGFFGNIASGAGRYNFYANGTADNYFAGNVGIGTNSPGNKLVTASNATNSKIEIQNTSTAASTSKTSALQFTGTDTVGTIKESGDIYVTPSDNNYVGSNMLFFTRGSDTTAERMRIDSSGVITSGLGGMQVISGTAVATTSGTSIDFTGIPSWVKRVTINFQGVSTNGTAEPLIKIGTSGGIQSSGYLGASCFLAVGSMGSRPYSTAPASSTGYAFFNDVTAAALRNGVVTLTLLDLSNGTWALQGMLGNSAENFSVISAGSKTLSGTLDRVRITTTNGTNTFDAGTINILYE